MSGLLLRLAGPLQSWGERSAFTPVRETALFPTRSALVGMFAAAQGIARGDTASLKKYEQVRLTVRVDRPGTLLEDYHTVGGGFPKERTAATSGGSNKDAAVITRRQYLADAAFVVAVTAPDNLAKQLAAALRRPYWAPYLGRRSCAPDEPFLLRRHVDDPETELLTGVPLTTPNPATGQGKPSRCSSSGSNLFPTVVPARRPTSSRSTTCQSASPRTDGPTPAAVFTAPSSR